MYKPNMAVRFSILPFHLKIITSFVNLDGSLLAHGSHPEVVSTISASTSTINDNSAF
jgi:hypothetical protein